MELFIWYTVSSKCLEMLSSDGCWSLTGFAKRKCSFTIIEKGFWPAYPVLHEDGQVVDHSLVPDQPQAVVEGQRDEQVLVDLDTGTSQRPVDNSVTHRILHVLILPSETHSLRFSKVRRMWTNTNKIRECRQNKPS